MNYIDKINVLEKVKQIKEEQDRITENTEYIIWYNDVMNIDNLQPCEDTYNDCKENLPKHKVRMVELENELETSVDVIDELESQYAFAKSNGHTNSAIKALELLSRVRGANSDIMTSLDEETLETAIVGCLNVIGEDKVYSLITKCDFYKEEDDTD